MFCCRPHGWRLCQTLPLVRGLLLNSLHIANCFPATNAPEATGGRIAAGFRLNGRSKDSAMQALSNCTCQFGRQSMALPWLVQCKTLARFHCLGCMGAARLYDCQHTQSTQVAKPRTNSMVARASNCNSGIDPGVAAQSGAHRCTSRSGIGPGWHAH